MIPLTFRPIDQWPEGWQDPNRKRRPTPFGAPYQSTLHTLQTELRHLRATSAHLQVDAAPGQVRNDGQLRASAKVEHPGVILTIDTPAHGVLVYPCDEFRGFYNTPGWQQNLRAIALGLEALRKVERYGIAARGQQYAGFAALAGGQPMGQPETMEPERAARVLLEASGYPMEDTARPSIDWVRGRADKLYKDAAKVYHPDSGNPLADASVFGRITLARDVLKGDA